MKLNQSRPNESNLEGVNGDAKNKVFLSVKTMSRNSRSCLFCDPCIIEEL